MDPPAVSVVVPTPGRVGYLPVALDSQLAPREAPPHELLVVLDGPGPATERVAVERGVRLVAHEAPRGLNAARNTGLRETRAPLVAFVDDDVLAPPGWLAALAAGAARHPEAGALGGPIRARLEGGRFPRGCGREDPPITTLDLGPQDREADYAWGANLAVRRDAVERVGPFDERIVRPHGDEEEWLERLRAAGGRVVYLAGAGLEHRRNPEDARLRPLARAAYARGRAARASDRRRGRAPALPAELRVLAGCGWHAARRRCPQGLIAGAHSAGRLAEALRPLPARQGEPR
jgi:GT2 family glycosyltransferase